MKSLKKGFTLVELIMVIAIIGIIATFAISKMSGYKHNAEVEVSIANISRTGNAIEVLMASGGKLNWLDNLVNSGYEATASSEENKNFMTGNGTSNFGITSGLRSRLAEYKLTASDAKALSSCLGLDGVYAALWTGNTKTKGDDDSKIDGNLIDSANTCSCVAITNLSGMVCAAINPIPKSSSDFKGAFLVYQACGQDVQFHQGGNLFVNGEDWSSYPFYASGRGVKSLISELPSSGGLLLAFGLGGNASCIGNNKCGLEEAPVSATVSKEYYSHYILLIRLKKIGQQAASEVVAEFAGVLDPEGRTHMLANWYKDQK